MRLKLAVAVLTLQVLAGAMPVLAHHGFAATFDASKPINLKGVISKVELMNPHSWLWIDVKNADGTVVTWGFEGGSPNSLIRHGVTKDSLPIGTEIVVTGFQAKNGETKGVAADMTFADGRKVFFGGSMPDTQTDSNSKKSDKY